MVAIHNEVLLPELIELDDKERLALSYGPVDALPSLTGTGANRQEPCVEGPAPSDAVYDLARFDGL